jgi:hypothetical protein
MVCRMGVMTLQILAQKKLTRQPTIGSFLGQDSAGVATSVQQPGPRISSLDWSDNTSQVNVDLTLHAGLVKAKSPAVDARQDLSSGISENAQSCALLNMS